MARAVSGSSEVVLPISGRETPVARGYAVELSGAFENAAVCNAANGCQRIADAENKIR